MFFGHLKHSITGIGHMNHGSDLASSQECSFVATICAHNDYSTQIQMKVPSMRNSEVIHHLITGRNGSVTTQGARA
jgi:hypothetical protein